jgi:hypothetical protein
MTSKEDRAKAIAITNNWRSSHAFPLNTLQMNLRRVARNFDSSVTVAQRQKRLPSIISKLSRLDWLSLADMQDLGGCRAVLTEVGEVEALAEYYLNASSMRHELVQQDHYIDKPKKSGYRSIHLIYAYQSDKNEIYNSLRIEMQLRSQLQHAWATAVETIDLFTSQALKSSTGEKRWLRFFALMSSALAVRESRPRVPGTPDDYRELIDELRSLAKRLQVIERLSGYAAAMQIIEDAPLESRFLILELDTINATLRVEHYNNQIVATDAYNALETATADEPGRDIVLVRVESLGALRSAYPNYFADTSVFVAALGDALAT